MGFVWVCQVSHSRVCSSVLYAAGMSKLMRFPLCFCRPLSESQHAFGCAGQWLCLVSQGLFRNELVLYNFSIPPSPGLRTSKSVALLCLGDIIGRLKARDKPVRQSDSGLLEQFRLLILVCGYANYFSNCCDYMADKGNAWGWGMFSLCSPGWPQLTV